MLEQNVDSDDKLPTPEESPEEIKDKVLEEENRIDDDDGDFVLEDSFGFVDFDEVSLLLFILLNIFNEKNKSSSEIFLGVFFFRPTVFCYYVVSFY